jgi:hypothetical protein
MVTVALPEHLTPTGVDDFLADLAQEQPADAILRFTCSAAVPPAVRRAFGSVRLAACLPPTMNYQFGSGFFGDRDQGRQS